MCYHTVKAMESYSLLIKLRLVNSQIDPIIVQERPQLFLPNKLSTVKLRHYSAPRAAIQKRLGALK
jgi:hypothetical protein